LVTVGDDLVETGALHKGLRVVIGSFRERLMAAWRSTIEIRADDGGWRRGLTQ